MDTQLDQNLHQLRNMQKNNITRMLNALRDAQPALLWTHPQSVTAGLAIAALERLSEFKVLDSHIVTGLRMVDWPARIQHLTRGPLVDRPLREVQLPKGALIGASAAARMLPALLGSPVAGNQGAGWIGTTGYSARSSVRARATHARSSSAAKHRSTML